MQGYKLVTWLVQADEKNVRMQVCSKVWIYVSMMNTTETTFKAEVHHA
jgi:hypothetical protein